MMIIFDHTFLGLYDDIIDWSNLKFNTYLDNIKVIDILLNHQKIFNILLWIENEG